MKRLWLIALSVLLLPWFAHADSILLTNPEQLSVPTAVTVDFIDVRIDPGNKFMIVRYRWKDTNGKPIQRSGLPVNLTWECRDRAATAEQPIPDTCFTDVFGFSIRQQDVGAAIGTGLRNLIWNRMKQTVLSPGNDGTFQ